MYKFGKRSLANLATVDDRLKSILEDAIEITDFAIVCGHRSKESQDAAFHAGNSKKRWPNSVHNQFPSMAVDVAPYNGGIDWNDSLAFARLFGIIEACAHRRGYRLRWGGDWDGDGSSRDQTFMDIGHLELVVPD